MVLHVMCFKPRAQAAKGFPTLPSKRVSACIKKRILIFPMLQTLIMITILMGVCGSKIGTRRRSFEYLAFHYNYLGACFNTFNFEAEIELCETQHMVKFNHYDSVTKSYFTKYSNTIVV